MQFNPIYDKVIVKIDNIQEIKSDSGLTVTLDMGKSTNTVCKGDVIAVGEGRLLSNGSIVPLKVHVGDKVLYPKMQGECITQPDGDYCILSESSILCVVEE